MRASSSFSVIAKAPGRVDSPPTSMMSQPAAAICCACDRAASMPTYCPPSENESGVRLRIPMTIGRVPMVARKASRRARCSARISLLLLVRGFAMVVLDSPVRMFADPLRKIRLCALRTFAQRTMPDIFDTLFLTLIGMRQRTDREYDGYQVHSAAPPSVERSQAITTQTEFATG